MKKTRKLNIKIENILTLIEKKEGKVYKTSRERNTFLELKFFPFPNSST